MAVRVLVPDMRKIARRLPSEAVARQVAARAINRAMDAGKTQAVREVSSNYVVKSKQVKERMTSSRANQNNLSSKTTWRGHALNLSDFKVTPGTPQPAKRPIIRATVSRKTGPVPYHGAFVIRARGKFQTFRRTSEARAKKTRYPITGVYGPSIPQLVGAKTVAEAVEKRAMDVLSQRIEHEISRELAKGMR